MHQTAPSTENSRAQNVNSAEGEKFWSQSKLEFCPTTLETMFLYAKGLAKLLLKNQKYFKILTFHCPFPIEYLVTAQKNEPLLPNADSTNNSKQNKQIETSHFTKQFGKRAKWELLHTVLVPQR